MKPDRDLNFGAEEAHRTVTEAAIHNFGTITGDYARMHFDHAFARSLEAEVPVAHGLLSASWALGALTRKAPERLLIKDPGSHVAALEVRFTQAVHLGDTLAIRWAPSAQHALDELSAHASSLALSTAFEVVNQDQRVTARGLVTALGEPPQALAHLAPDIWEDAQWKLPTSPSIFYAEDLVDSGPRGRTTGQTVTLADAVQFAREVGDLDPRTLNKEFAQKTANGQRTVPPMFVFCLGFAEFLEQLLTAPMPSAGFAGHLGDSWRAFQPVVVEDTIRTRHRPLGFRPSKSRPGQAIVRYGLQFINQRNELVQDGEVSFMIPSRDAHQES